MSDSTSYSYRNKAKRSKVLHISKTKGFTKFFSCNALNSTISNVIPMPSCLYPLTSSVIACPAWAPASMKTLCKSLPEVPLDTCKGPENKGRDYITTYFKHPMNFQLNPFYYKIDQKLKTIWFLFLKINIILMSTLSNLLTFYFIKPMNFDLKPNARTMNSIFCCKSLW